MIGCFHSLNVVQAFENDLNIDRAMAQEGLYRFLELFIAGKVHQKSNTFQKAVSCGKRYNSQ